MPAEAVAALMPIPYVCLGCREEMSLPDQKAGQLCACPRCRLKFLAPARTGPPRAGGGAPPLYSGAPAQARPAPVRLGTPPGASPPRGAPAPLAPESENGDAAGAGLFGVGAGEPRRGLFGQDDVEVGELFGGATAENDAPAPFATPGQGVARPVSGPPRSAPQAPPHQAPPHPSSPPRGAPPPGPYAAPGAPYPYPYAPGGGPPGYPPPGYPPPGYPGYPPPGMYPGYPPPGYGGYPPPGYPGYPPPYGHHPPTPPGGVPVAETPTPSAGMQLPDAEVLEQEEEPQLELADEVPVRRAGGAPTAGGRGCRLVVLEGLPEGTEYHLPAGKIYDLGRDKEADVKILSTSVSRRQARIDATGASPVLIDCGSANGTQVNGAVVGRHPLREGDLIKMGKVLFRYQGA